MPLLLIVMNAAGAAKARSQTTPNNTTGSPSSYNCGDGVEIRYPFWTDTGDDSSNPRCGYPIFRLDCRDGITPLLRLRSRDYTITRITYDDTDKATGRQSDDGMPYEYVRLWEDMLAMPVLRKAVPNSTAPSMMSPLCCSWGLSSAGAMPWEGSLAFSRTPVRYAATAGRRWGRLEFQLPQPEWH
uniref:Wall-associated receptor kinase galacturonan-binding domain-containing protein n=1 Tax=Aegilops tauschii TaxID=37682 RepID=M8BN18_AEGTA